MFCKYCGNPMEFGQKECGKCGKTQGAYVQSNVELNVSGVQTEIPSNVDPEPDRPLSRPFLYAILGGFVFLLLVDLFLFAMILGVKRDSASAADSQEPSIIIESSTEAWEETGDGADETETAIFEGNEMEA